MTNHPQRHRRSIRLQGYDYSRAGAYFITICSYQRKTLFGRVHDDLMELSDLGRIVETEWLRTPSVRPQVELDGFVVMPNHLHGILVFREDLEAPPSVAFQSPSRTIGAIVRGFKAAVTRQAKASIPNIVSTVWQRGYWEHVIRNEQDLHDIRQYIIENPTQWNRDRENPNRKV